MTETTVATIPFNRPSIVGAELDYIADVIRSGHAAGDGAYTKRCQALLESITGSSKAFLTTSCTDALELSALLLDLRDGDDVIVPSFTFVSTANAFAIRGARPVFIDIRADTLNLDERLLERVVTPRTKAIYVVHYAGVACEMDEIMAFAAARGLVVVEDNAHGLFGTYRGRALGSIGSLATQSFHETKNVICGEGGALLINDSSYVERAEILREKGTDRARFFRGQVDKYSWVDIGSSFLPSDLLAAFLYAQLEAREQIQGKRHAIWDRYRSGLRDWAERNEVRLPFIPSHCEQPYHMFYLLMHSLEERQRFIGHLKERGIHAVFHYVALHQSVMGRRFGGRDGDCPITEHISDRLVRLPFYNDLSVDQQDRVISAVRDFRL